ncbi:SDR family oxidoreductase [Sphingomonas sp. C3-2]|uniref:SDR family oxidoreductase n=1 Tax=Sphingomonas sp. C3-2 TaxID=3062169 RepID=UPI00294AA11F|nr:SDR family oxidoreductase [Sphingomonas sp. C3-2]WOK35349.1 SDR family oxidoreductase [Sphingomonas sp. C3-2]
MRIIVTGSAGILGTAVVQTLLARSHAVVGIDRKKNTELPDTAHQIIADNLADRQGAATAIAEAERLVGGIDGLVHLVGGFDWVPVEQSTLETWRTLYSVNVETALSTILAALPAMSEGGAILCVGAAAANQAQAGMAPYTAAKSGVARMVEALSAEVKTRKIRINAVLPSIIDTPRNRADMPDANPDEWTKPVAIADVVDFLLSDNARAINGALIPVTNNA